MAKSKAAAAAQERETLYTAAELLSIAFANRTRTLLLRALAESPERMSGTALVAATGVPQSAVSMHMVTLYRNGLVKRERVGVWSYYSLDKAAFARCVASVGDGLRFDVLIGSVA